MVMESLAHIILDDNDDYKIYFKVRTGDNVDEDKTK